MFKALMVEIKNTIFKSAFHFVRFFGLLLIPTVYGFSYIYAFYNPFEKTSEVKVSLISKKGDYLADAIGNQFAKENGTKMGDIDMTVKMEHIYDANFDEVKKESYATIELGDMSPITAEMVKYVQAKNTATPIAVPDLLKSILAIAHGADDKHPLIKMSLNYKKNYLLAFGVDASARMWSSIQFVEQQLLIALKDPNYIEHLLKQAGVANPTHQQIQGIAHEIDQSISLQMHDFHPIQTEAHMGEHAKYGYGLAPFFISVAMWIGCMVMTFSVHRKIYDKTIEPGKRYFAKWILIAFGVVVQASILLTALYFIGFGDLGIKHWLFLYGGAIVSGLVFSAIVQAIRNSVYNRTLGIFSTIILLVIQMASGGGLFPIETQSEVYQIINKIVPMGRSVNILRELMFETNWGSVLIDFGYLAIWLLIIPVAVYINNRRTLRYYKRKDWELPPRMAYREHVKQMKKGGDQ